MSDSSPEPSSVELEIADVVRRDGGRLIAVLARQFGDLDLADESLQDAMEEAVRRWPADGVPTNPPAWLLTVARRKAIDHLRRATSARRRTLAAAPELELRPTDEDEEAVMTLDHAGIRDDQLRLILLCCHPALDADAQSALVLRLVAGLTTTQIAAAYVISEATLAQRIVRAKNKIKKANIPLIIPAAYADRIDLVLRVIYLIFNEGYLTHGDQDRVIRVDLVDEAVRLTGLIIDLAPDHPEAKALLALELFHRARSGARLDAAGELVLLEDQDRTSWDLAEIGWANRALRDAVSAGPPGTFGLQAVIAGLHANARTAADTNWPAIAQAYRQLTTIDASPVVALNHAVAVAMADGPLVGLRLLHEITGLERYHLFHAARGELLWRSGDHPAARAALTRARELAANPAEQRHLDRRLALL